MADAYCANRFSRWLLGPSLPLLSADSTSYVCRLPPLLCEVGIIAGGRGDSRGYKDYLPGDDDGKVSVEATKLDGMKDFLFVQSGHSFIINSDIVKNNVVSFLRSGRFLHDPIGTGENQGP
jgi:hypothetical protein